MSGLPAYNVVGVQFYRMLFPEIKTTELSEILRITENDVLNAIDFLSGASKTQEKYN